MALNKRTYTDEVTIITAENLNEIQDHIIALESNPVAEWGAIEGQISDQEDLSAELSGKEKTISKQTGAPASPTEGDLWLDTDAEETLSANDVGYDATETYDTGTVGAVISAQSSQIETLDEEKADATDLTAEVTRATEAENTLGAQIASLNALGFSVINGEINITFEEEET